MRGETYMDLAVDFMGLKLKNPIMVAAGPLTATGEMLRQAVEAGAGAVVTKTIVNEIRPKVRPRLAALGEGMQNIELYTEFSLEAWEHEIRYAKSHGAVIIANILAHTPSEMADIALRVEKFGADAIELGVACPHGEGLEGLFADPAQLYSFTKSVVQRVNIPVMVKLSPNVTNMAKMAMSAEQAGASAVSAIDTVRAIIGVDLESGRPLLSTYGGYSGPPVRPIGLAAVALISQAAKIPVCGIGGISNSHHVLEYMMLGASTVQLCTSLILNGLDSLSKIIHDLETWLMQHNVADFGQIRGKALQSLKSFEEIKVEPYVAKALQGCSDLSCNLCVRGCIYKAVHKSKFKVTVDQNLCTGCGLCLSVCPDKAFVLEWK
ncbi:Dihydroorotate dehydrogenase domain protein [Acididesulfobacillus acetoxydans]|uniref:Dihydroorotate dehydrogenase B (NAD(+)), catalytic subunit n=2 Tax=Acididesulfobacillus acetoxydans TaxID=1561005 RepID=A0A8S0X4N5_9FIRM|nr:Dihydroorotate dehydrogenase domain protein [Acididesulfobacillus acetoxydans]CEJ08904.1 Dihydroorotate dehydrogenase B (NAD(+)), catalytic subunit [Acididesulfobacillus acetoxydans]